PPPPPPPPPPEPAPAPVLAAPPAPVFPPLPVIAAVVGGPRPFLLLADGQKWLPGGRLAGLVLQAIDDTTMVFEDGQGNVLRKPR
ncbi:MAG: hypothetical protein WCK08_17150, partial [Betaproteobacteria bacterium]